MAIESTWVQRAGVFLAGVTATTIGVGFVPFLVDGASVRAFAAVVATVAGLVLVVQSARRPHGFGRYLAPIGAVVVTGVVVWTLAPAVMVTNRPATEVTATPDSRGLDYETVTVTTADGVHLAGWYVPSTNRAAVVLRHGAGSTRSAVLDHAAVLARNGFGVLLLDARGHGDSAGTAMDFGWYGDADIAAGVTFLVERDDVDADRVGSVGMSMGGEEAIGAAASDPRIRAVVAEGATNRVAADEAWLSDVYGIRGWIQEVLEVPQDTLTDVLTSAHEPISLRRAVATSQARFLLITAGDVPDEGHAAAAIAAAAPDRTEVWTVPGAGHTKGLRVAGAKWERRVMTFLDATLLGG